MVRPTKLERLGGIALAHLLLASAAAAQSPGDDSTESITVARAWREERSAPTDFCTASRTTFMPTFEDRFTWRAIVTRSDGLVTDANAQTIGGFRACFGVRADASGTDIYVEGDLNQVAFRGNGVCQTDATDHPQPGLAVSRCHVVLRDLSSGYTAGYLTSNAVNSRNVLGGVSDPPGYAQASIATVRLWRPN